MSPECSAHTLLVLDHNQTIHRFCFSKMLAGLVHRDSSYKGIFGLDRDSSVSFYQVLELNGH